ncbi:MAG: hypothetical protein ACM3XO_26090 [Bacteroidota bacterium]
MSRLRIQLAEQDIGGQVGDIQLVGMLGRLEGQLKVAFLQAGLCQGQVDQRRVG